MCQSDDLDPYEGYLNELFEAGLLVPSGVPGVYGRGGDFEHVIEQFERLVTAAGRHLDPEVIRFPPVFNRAHYCRINHVYNFPDLLGSVHTFTGRDREHRALLRRFEEGEDWTGDLAPAEVMMIPAACYPLYPTATGPSPRRGAWWICAPMSSATSPRAIPRACRSSGSASSSAWAPPSRRSPTGMTGWSAGATCSARWGSRWRR